MASVTIKNLPAVLYRRLRKQVQENNRSISQEVTHILSRALEEPNLRSIIELRGLGKAIWDGVSPERHVETQRHAWD